MRTSSDASTLVNRTAISVDKLGKEYVIGQRENASETFREMLVSAMAAPFRRLKRLGGNVVPQERIWALKDVTFEIEEGAVIGLIGRNGAGKSTLLKILSRITAPTEGRVKIRGRCSSLLEVGTGFHPELTGRENINLNGALLGMSRAEIHRKFDAIVNFSGVEKFLDTPVKRYSSGMAVRLAFAVAAHLEPDIFIVDEVLAVGDAEFQKKCLGKMHEISRGEGRTILFVSHNMNAIRSLCQKCILLESGRLLQYEATRHVLANYLSPDQSYYLYERQSPTVGRKAPTIVRAAIRFIETSCNSDLPALCLELGVWSNATTTTNIDVRLKDGMGTPIAFGSLGALTRERPIRLSKGNNNVRLKLTISELALGDYYISLDLSHPFVEYYDRVEDCLKFRVDASMLNGGSAVTMDQLWGYGSWLLRLQQLQQPREDERFLPRQF